MRQYSAIINILEVSGTRKGSVKEANTELSIMAPSYVCMINVTQDKAYFFHTQKTDQMSVTFEWKTELADYSVQEEEQVHADTGEGILQSEMCHNQRTAGPATEPRLRRRIPDAP